MNMGDILSTSDAQEKYKNADEDTKQLINRILERQEKAAQEKRHLVNSNKLKTENETRLKEENFKLKNIIESFEKSDQESKVQNDRLRKGIHSLQTCAQPKTHKGLSNSGVIDTTKMVEDCFRQQATLETEKNELSKRIEKLKTENKIVNDENKKLRSENIILSSEKESALSRLSKIAGIQLTKGNSEIADLSDANRPTSLAEKWSSLYTDEWSEAYSEMTMKKTLKNEDFKVEKELCKIAKTCYSICQQIEHKQITDIKTHAWDIACCLHHQPDQLVSSAQTTQFHKVNNKASLGVKAVSHVGANQNQPAGTDFNKVLAIQKCMEELLQIVIERRKYDKKLLEYVIQEAVRQFSNDPKLGSKGQVIIFVKRCTELCWSMVIKEPPMVLVHDEFEGKPMDKNLFAFYTKNGPVIDFVIWPALTLKRNGPILSKGSVQGKDGTTSQTHETKNGQEMKHSLNGSKSAPIKQQSTEKGYTTTTPDDTNKASTAKPKNRNEQ